MFTIVNVSNFSHHIWFKIASLIALCLLQSCHIPECDFKPEINCIPPPYCIENLPCPFPRLSPEEKTHDWAKELYLGRCFARQLDYYRALTCFKSALFINPKKNIERRAEIEFEILLAYYLGTKYQDVIDFYETSTLTTIDDSFAAIKELYLLLQDSYTRLDRFDEADNINCKIKSINKEIAQDAALSQAIISADFYKLCEISQSSPIAENLTSTYSLNKKSPAKAGFLNAILPGSGYLYVGQKKSALTSFFINALFIAASLQLFEKGYYPAAIILSSIEMGWYVGGIQGAALAANEYNLRLYQRIATDTLRSEKLYPILMFQKGF